MSDSVTRRQQQGAEAKIQAKKKTGKASAEAPRASRPSVLEEAFVTGLEAGLAVGLETGDEELEAAVEAEAAALEAGLADGEALEEAFEVGLEAGIEAGLEIELAEHELERELEASEEAPRPGALGGKDRRRLRAQGHHLRPLVLVGSAGVTPGVISALDAALEDHELVKVRIDDDRAGRAVAAVDLAHGTRSEIVQSLGKTVLFFRRRTTEPASKDRRAGPRSAAPRGAAPRGAGPRSAAPRGAGPRSAATRGGGRRGAPSRRR